MVSTAEPVGALYSTYSTGESLPFSEQFEYGVTVSLLQYLSPTLWFQLQDVFWIDYESSVHKQIEEESPWELL